MATIDQQFVEFVVKALVNEPDSVEINRTIDEKGVLLELSVAQEDLGRVIGKRGNTAQSIRTLLRALGTKNDARYNLKIVDPEDDRPRSEPASQPKREQEEETPATEETATDTVAEETGSSNQWAHLSSSSDEQDEDGDEEVDNSTDTEEESSTEAENDAVEKHKKDLADLDDFNL